MARRSPNGLTARTRRIVIPMNWRNGWRRAANSSQRDSTLAIDQVSPLASRRNVHWRLSVRMFLFPTFGIYRAVPLHDATAFGDVTVMAQAPRSNCCSSRLPKARARLRPLTLGQMDFAPLASSVLDAGA